MKKSELSVKNNEFENEAVPHMDILYNYAVRMTGSTDDAHDLVQETYLKAFRFWDKYEKGTNIRAWLFRIMKNTYINQYRKETKEPDMVDYDEIQNFYNTIKANKADENDLQEKIFSGLMDDKITHAVESLPEDFRTVVILSDIEGLSYDEISEFLDCPIGTVRSRLHRGRKILHTRLSEYAKEHGYLNN